MSLPLVNKPQPQMPTQEEQRQNAKDGLTLFIIQQLVMKMDFQSRPSKEFLRDDLVGFVEAADAAAKRWLELK